MVNVYVPATVGVPLNVAPLNDNPVGKLPEAIAYVYGLAPPVVEKV